MDDPYSEGEALLKPESCFLVLDMLSHNPEPEGQNVDRWRLEPRHIAWKTGTSVGFRDAWAVAVFDHYVAAVWVGNFSGKGNPAFVGRYAAGPLLFELIQSFSKLRDVSFKELIPEPTHNLSKVYVCSLSGQIPNDDCPNKESVWFIPGVSPIEKCTVHRRINIDTENGFQVCPEYKEP